MYGEMFDIDHSLNCHVPIKIIFCGYTTILDAGCSLVCLIIQGRQGWFVKTPQQAILIY